MSKLPCANTMIFKKYPPLKSGPPEISVIQREFRRNEGDDDFATHPPIVVDRIVMDVCPRVGNGSTGLPTGAPVVVDNVLQTIDFAYSGVISELYRNGLDYFSGIIANVKYYLGGVLIHSWNIAKEALSEIDLIAGTLLTFVNSSPSNWGLFDKTATGWIGQELVVNGGFDSDSGWSKAAGVTIAGGVALYDVASNQNMNQSFAGASGSAFNAKMDIKSFASGNIQFSIDGGVGPKWSAIGSYSVELTTSGANSKLFIPADFGSGFNGSIDNVSVKEVLKNA